VAESGICSGDWGFEKSLTNECAEEILTYAVEELKLRKMHDEAEDI
jgi:hypothetical protein